MKEIIGHKILEIYIGEGEVNLMLKTLDKFCVPQNIIYEGYGDCCSETWFSDIEGVEALINAVVEKIEKIPMCEIERDTRSRQDSDKIYAIKIITDKGYAIITFRNSSNGYYGGNVEFVDANKFLVDENSQTVIYKIRWKKITEDWSS